MYESSAVQELVYNHQRSLCRTVTPSFPASEVTWVNSEQCPEFLARQTESLSVSPEPFSHRFGLAPIKDVIAKKIRDSRSESETRNNPICLPVLNRASRHSYLIGNLSLQQAEIKPALPEVVSDSVKLCRICSIPWLSGT